MNPGPAKFTCRRLSLALAASGGKRQLSINGGVRPFWRRDGRELYYISADGKLMVVEITPGAELKAGTPKELFAPGGYRVDAVRGLHGDGRRAAISVCDERGRCERTAVHGRAELDGRGEEMNLGTHFPACAVSEFRPLVVAAPHLPGTQTGSTAHPRLWGAGA